IGTSSIALAMGSVHDIRIYSSTLAEFLSNFGTSSNTKKIAEFVFGANKEFVRGLIRGYFLE
ncbi:hypothetical protein, partial [Klebsiella aerogenes]|uniref:hypothetical protein n=1 Tax=Klebsiella aerogenes TaxID=548 RepID=UPI001954D038